MKKALLVFAYFVENKAEFEQIICRFEENDYLICSFDGIEPENFDYGVLPDLVTDLKGQYPGLVEFAVVSNIREAIFSWYRCYNALITDFIYFIDQRESRKLVVSPQQPYSRLAQFAGIEAEFLAGKIYLNLNHRTAEQVIMFLLQGSNYHHFDAIENFEYHKTNRKRLTDKSYTYKDQIFHYQFGTGEKSAAEFINLDDATLDKRVLQLTPSFLDGLNEYDYLLKYFVLFWYPQNNANEILVNLLRMIEAGVSAERKLGIYWDLMKYIQDVSEDFYEQSYLLSLLSILNIREESFLAAVMGVLARDIRYMDYHYTLLFNTVFYLDNCQKKLSQGYFLDRDYELNRILTTYQIQLKRPETTQGKRIAFFVDQLRTKLHSPTKQLFDYLRALEKSYPEYEVKVFVEDNFACSDNERFLPRMFMSEFSVTYQKQHLEYLGKESSNLVYADPTLSKKERTQQLLREVACFNPEALFFFGGDCSICRAYLYGKYPIIYVAIGFFAYSRYADIYLCGNKTEVGEDQSVYGVLDRNDVFEFNHGFNAPLPTKQFAREDIGLSSCDFVMITVGNRLDAEMGADYIDAVGEFLERVEVAKWLIVGPQKIGYLEGKYQSSIQKGLIVFIDYEEDLAGLYGICDVYLNPPRNGGGFTIGIAMSRGLPVVTLNHPTDARRFVGEENTAGINMNQYMAELIMIFEDQGYRYEKGQKMQAALGNFSFETAVQQLISFIPIAQQRLAAHKSGCS